MNYLLPKRRGRSARLASALVVCLACLGWTCAHKDQRDVPVEAPEGSTGYIAELVLHSVYDVSDLIEIQRDFDAPTLGVSVKDSKVPPPPPDDAKERERKLRELTALLRANVRPEIWGGTGHVEAVGTQLLVEAPVSVQEEARAFLAKRRRELETMVRVEGAFVSISEAVLERLEPPLRKKLQLGNPHEFQAAQLRLTQKEVERLVELTPPEVIPQFPMPEVTAYNHQRAHTLAVNQSAFISHVKVVEKDGKKEAEPVIGLLSTGVVLEVEPVVSQDGDHLTLDLNLQYTDVIEPIATVVIHEVDGLKNLNVPIEVPELSAIGLRTSVSLPFGEWGVAGGFHSFVRTKNEAAGQTRGTDRSLTTLALIRATLIPTKKD